jgi:hypothetical protein
MTVYSCLSVAWSASARVDESALLRCRADTPALLSWMYPARLTIAAVTFPPTRWMQEAGVERA